MRPFPNVPSALRVGGLRLLAWLALLPCATLCGCGMVGEEGPDPADGQAREEVSPYLAEDTASADGPATQQVPMKDDGRVVGALETYRYWAGQDPDKDMRVLNGEYWASAHWTKEYSLFMELEFPRAKDFVMGQRFKRSEQWREMAGAPDWFTPPDHYEVWEGGQGSLYYLDPKKGHLYMFERQF